MNKSSEIHNYESELLESLDEIKYLEVFSSPVKKHIILEYELSQEFDSGTLSIIKSVSGKSIFTKQLQHQQDAITIDLREFTSGQY